MGTTYQSPSVLRQAMIDTIRTITQLSTKNNCGRSLLNFAVTDGRTVLITKYSHGSTTCASLYFSVGSTFGRCDDGIYRMKHHLRDEDVVIVCSERLTVVHEDWVE